MEKLSKVALLLSALAITGVTTGAAMAMSQSDLRTVRELVAARDVTGLREFVERNPHVLDDSILGRELAVFMQRQPRQNVFTALGLVNPMPESLRYGVETMSSANALY